MTNMVVISLLLLFIEAEQEHLQESLNRQKNNAPSKQTQRKKPMCHTCGKPRKGHKKGSCD